MDQAVASANAGHLQKGQELQFRIARFCVCVHVLFCDVCHSHGEKEELIAR